MFLTTPVVSQVNVCEHCFFLVYFVQQFTEVALGTFVAFHGGGNPIVIGPPEIFSVRVWEKPVKYAFENETFIALISPGFLGKLSQLPDRISSIPLYTYYLVPVLSYQ